MKKELAEGFGEGSSPQTGNISDSKLKEITGFPTGTLSRWKKEDNSSYKRKVYELLKVITPEEYAKFQDRIKEFDNL